MFVLFISKVNAQSDSLKIDTLLKKVRLLHENGILKIEGFKKNNKKEGLWKHYDDSGKLFYKVYYKDDKLIEENYLFNKYGKNKIIIKDSEK